MRSRQIDRLFDYIKKPFDIHESEPTPPRQRQHRLTSKEMVAVAQAYRAGASMKALAQSFQVHRTTIAACLTKLGIPIRQPGLRTEDVPSAIALYDAGWSLSCLGEHFGCDAETVRQAFVREGVARRAPHERPDSGDGGRLPRMRPLVNVEGSAQSERMDHCGAPTVQIDDGNLTEAQQILIATFDNECLMDNGHVGHHVIRREDGAELRWSSEEPGKFGFYPA